MHYKVQIVIISIFEKPKLLLLQTTKERGSFWQNVTGSIEPSECPLKAALREVREETGLHFEGEDVLINLHHPLNYTTKQGKEIEEFTFLLKLSTSPEKIEIDPKEHQSYQWKPIDEVKEEDFGYTSNFIIFQKATAHLIM